MEGDWADVDGQNEEYGVNIDLPGGEEIPRWIEETKRRWECGSQSEWNGTV